MTKIKVCGVTRIEDAAEVARAGVEYLGVNFWERSKRRVTSSRAAEIAGAARDAGSVTIVGVFVNHAANEVVEIAREAKLDIVQLHGDETVEDAEAIAAASGLPVWKAIAAKPGVALQAWAIAEIDAVLLDTPSPQRGGTGVAFDWSIAAEARESYAGRVVLAGGLHAGNVAEAIAAVEPWAVDVASGVESAPGVKDAAKIAALVSAVRQRGA